MKNVFNVVAFYRTGRFIKKWNRVETDILAADEEHAKEGVAEIMKNEHPDNLWFIAQVHEEEEK